MDLKIMAGLALLFVLAVLCLNIKIVIKGIYGPQNQGLYLEVILPGRLWKREFSLERFSGGIKDGFEPYLKWQQEQEGPGGEPLAEGEKGFKLEDMSLVWHRVRQGLKVFINLRSNSVVRWMLRAFTPFKVIEWRTAIGFGDAMETALATAVLWGLKGGAVVAIGHISPPQKVDLSVIPSFNQPVFQSEFKFIMSPKIIQIVGLAIAIWIEVKRVARQA